MRQEVVLAKFQPHASQMHFKWAEIRYCLQFTVNSNELLHLVYFCFSHFLHSTFRNIIMILYNFWWGGNAYEK